MKIVFLLERGSPPRLNPVIVEAIEILAARGVSSEIRYPEEELIRLDNLRPAADLYLLKSDTGLSLSVATALEQIGARVINPARACILCRNKLLAVSLLSSFGIPSPFSFAASDASMLGPALSLFPLIFKPYRGYHGAGITVAEDPSSLPPEGLYPGVVFAQEYLGKARKDLKVFGIGSDLFAVRKTFSRGSFLEYGEACPLPPAAADIARNCASAFGLQLYGIDLAEDESGFSVLDVNYFPGYRGVPRAPRLLADFICAKARGNR